nr:11996_t:CDS:2 [Entrophospora candida]
MSKYAELPELDCEKVLGLRLSGNNMSELSKKSEFQRMLFAIHY